MKRILCHLAQRNLPPSGRLSKHVSSCHECRKFFEQVSSLEARLATGPGEPDRDLCAAILAGIASDEPVPFIKPQRSWMLSPRALSAAAILVISLLGVLIVPHFKTPPQVAHAPVSQDVVPPPAPAVSQKMTLAYAVQQQELLQKDALKLGTHLRETLILFRTGDP